MICQDIYAKNDTFISMKNKYKNYSKSPYLLVGEDRSFSHIKDINISFMQFELEKISKLKEIDKAQLYLYINSELLYKDNFLFEIELYLISSPYEYSRVNFKNSPNIEKTNCGGIINNCKNNGYIIVDVIPILKHWIMKGHSNYGIALFGKSPKSVISLSSSKGCRSPFLRITSNCYIIPSKYYGGCDLDNNLVIEDNKYILGTKKVREMMNVRIEEDVMKGGSQGITGATGAIGVQGLRGITGATGPKGEKGEKGECGPQGITGVTGPRGESGTQNFAQFVTESSINVNSGQFIPFNNIFIVGENIEHLEGSTDILLTQNHSYFISWSITSLPSNFNFQVGGQIILNGERVIQSATRNSVIENIQEISMNNSCIINCEDKQNTIQLRYYSNTDRLDEITIAELCVIEIR